MGKRDSAHHGILAVDKPTGMTSTDVVRRVRHIMNTRRVGHTGTLDPDASGLLLVCVGEGTKAVQFLLEGTKTYVCEATLGAETQTDDAAGEVIRTADWDMVTRDALEARLSFFNGTIDQVPPRVSAIKKDGKRMYKRVLAGEDVDALLEARPVELHSLTLKAWNPPHFTLEMTVGKGFYVRSLVRDLGRMLDSAAHVTTLRRTALRGLQVEHALSLDEITPASLISVNDSLVHLPTLVVGPETTELIKNGIKVPLTADLETTVPITPGDTFRVHTQAGDLVAVAECTDEDLIKVVRGFMSNAPDA